MNLRLCFYKIVIRGEKKVAKKRPVFFAFGLLQKREERERPRSPDERKAAKKNLPFYRLPMGRKAERGAPLSVPHPFSFFCKKCFFICLSSQGTKKALKSK